MKDGKTAIEERFDPNRKILELEFAKKTSVEKQKFISKRYENILEKTEHQRQRILLPVHHGIMPVRMDRAAMSRVKRIGPIFVL